MADGEGRRAGGPPRRERPGGFPGRRHFPGAANPPARVTRQAGGRTPPLPQVTVPARATAAARVALTLALFAVVAATISWVIMVDLTHRGAILAQASASPRPTARQPPDPFLGSPAQAYASGAAGLVPPPARAAGRYSPGQVGRAYAMVKRLLIAAHLDHRTLLGGSPDAFARLLPPAERRVFRRDLGRRGLTRQGWPRSSRSWVSSFAPGSVEFVTSVVKVHGTMHAQPAIAPGGTPILRVKADYLFVYAVQRAGRPATRMRVVVRDVAWADFGQWHRAHGPLQPWWSPHGGGTAGGQCGAGDGFIHPAFPGSRSGHTRPSGSPIDPYDQSVPPPLAGCQATLGT